MTAGQKKTAVLLLAGVGLIALMFGGYIVWEAHTLANDIADDHITAVIQIAWEKEPGAILFVSCLVTAVVCILASHWFWGARRPKV